MLLQDLVTRQAARRPEGVAVVAGDEVLTYEDLERRSNRLANALREAGCRPGHRVGLLFPKSPTAIVAMLATLKAGAMYVPLDPAGPASRLRRIMETATSPWLLAGGSVAALLREMLGDSGFAEGLAVGWLDPTEPPACPHLRAAFLARDVESASETAAARQAAPDDPAHLLFTSGSTGSPKGVMVTHASVLHFLRWAVSYFGTGAEDRVSGHPPLHFDLSTFDIYGTFMAGARLYLVPAEMTLLPARLAEFIRGSALTQWFSVPSVLNYLAKFDCVRANDFPALRRVLWCGEVLPTPTLIYWMQRLPHVRFTNLYGPTEATIASSYYTVPRCPEREDAPIPIGTPCAGEELLVLDEEFRPVRPGEIGDLYIRGVGLSPGYWVDPERTREAFLPWPRGAGAGGPDRIYRTGDLALVGADGNLYFVGRADSQIKSRGYRIELGEIEAALHSLGVLRDCAVVAVRTEGFEGNAICCAYVAPGEVTPTVLRTRLSERLPGYMLPSRWLALPALPTNANGKIDRPALRAHFAA